MIIITIIIMHHFFWVGGWFFGFSQLMWVKLCFCPIAFVGYVHDEEREKIASM
jgi:hypothetical protein